MPGSRPLSCIASARRAPSQKPGQIPTTAPSRVTVNVSRASSRAHLPGGRPDGTQEGDLALALLHEQRDHAGEHQGGDEQRDAAEGAADRDQPDARLRGVEELGLPTLVAGQHRRTRRPATLSNAAATTSGVGAGVHRHAPAGRPGRGGRSGSAAVRRRRTPPTARSGTGRQWAGRDRRDRHLGRSGRRRPQTSGRPTSSRNGAPTRSRSRHRRSGRARAPSASRNGVRAALTRSARATASRRGPATPLTVHHDVGGEGDVGHHVGSRRGPTRPPQRARRAAGPARRPRC